MNATLQHAEAGAYACPCENYYFGRAECVHQRVMKLEAFIVFALRTFVIMTSSFELD